MFLQKGCRLLIDSKCFVGYRMRSPEFLSSLGVLGEPLEVIAEAVGGGEDVAAGDEDAGAAEAEQVVASHQGLH